MWHGSENKYMELFSKAEVQVGSLPILATIYIPTLSLSPFPAPIICISNGTTRDGRDFTVWSVKLEERKEKEEDK